MRRVGRVFVRLLTLVIGIFLVVFLGTSAFKSAKALILNSQANHLHIEQQTIFPGTATIIAQIYSRIDFDKTNAPPVTITPTAADSTDSGVDNSAGSGNNSAGSAINSGTDSADNSANAIDNSAANTVANNATDSATGSADVAAVPSGDITQQQIAQLESPSALPTESPTVQTTSTGVAVAMAATIDYSSSAGKTAAFNATTVAIYKSGAAIITAMPINTDVPTITLTPTIAPPSLTSTPTPTVPAAATTSNTPTAVASIAAQTGKLVAQLPPATNTKRPSLTPVVAQGGGTLTATTAASNGPAVPDNSGITNTVTAAPITVTPANTIDVAAIGPTHKLPSVNLPAARTERPQVTAIPPPAPRMKSPDGDDVLNIVLLGSDQDDDPKDPSFRTDSILIVSIDRTRGTVSMLSVPRDLFVYIPSLGMQRINTAFQWGEAVGWQPGGGFGLLQQTILYNLGIPVHYYALVSFDGFKQIVDTYHGVDVAVDCPISDLRFQGQYDAQQTPIYSPYTLGVGYYHMDGSLALWYARMRHDTSDFDRSRRQQQVLRSILRTAREQGLLANAPALWSQVTTIVKTNMQLPDVLGLVPIALSLKPGDITSYYMQKGYELQHWQTPQGEDVQIPDPKGFFQTITNFYTPPTKNRLDDDSLGVDIINGTSNKDWDKVAADRLAWEGFNPTAKGTGDLTDKTVIYDYTGSAKPAALGVMMKALNVKPSQVVSQPDPNRTVDFKVVLGKDYNSCSVPGFATS